MRADLQTLSSRRLHLLPVALALIAVTLGGGFLLHRADAQARDTIRKHHLEDIEKSLYLAFDQHGTYPPYDQATWCGTLDDPANTNVRQQIENALRAQNEKYENPDKPFPADPLHDLSYRVSTPLAKITRREASAPNTPGYFYWKRSPAIFELYSILEVDRNGDRSTNHCDTIPNLVYDYGLNSRTRTSRLEP